jgi:hypothetical protein
LEQRLRDDETRAAQQSPALTPSIAGAEQMAAWSERQGETEVAGPHELAGEELSLTVDRSKLRKYGEF